MLYIERKYCSRCGGTLYSSLIIVISLQLRGRRQNVEPRKYYLVRVIVFLWRVFSLIFVSHGLGIRFNSLHSYDCESLKQKILPLMFSTHPL